MEMARRRKKMSKGVKKRRILNATAEDFGGRKWKGVEAEAPRRVPPCVLRLERLGICKQAECLTKICCLCFQ